MNILTNFVMVLIKGKRIINCFYVDRNINIFCVTVYTLWLFVTHFQCIEYYEIIKKMYNVPVHGQYVPNFIVIDLFSPIVKPTRCTSFSNYLFFA
jgi:hypothetical protein